MVGFRVHHGPSVSLPILGRDHVPAEQFSERLGLTPARLRGIRESRGELLVFVDDDNVLERDYLEVALALA